MSTELKRMWNTIHWYKEETGIEEIDMNLLAGWAHKKGWPLPPPADPLLVLARKFARAARQEICHDPKTGRPYRRNHPLKVQRGSQQLTLWIDIERATRPRMLKSMVTHREQILGEVLQFSYDQDYWNSINPSEDPLQLPLDFTQDVEWRKAAPDEEDKKAG